MSKLLLPFEWQLLGGTSKNVVGNWQREEHFLPQTESWEDYDTTVFPTSIIRLKGATRYYYSICPWNQSEADSANMVLAEDGGGQLKKYLLSKAPAAYFSLTGMPKNSRPIQPVVIRLADDDWRMYFWIHGGTPHMCRFLMAQSSNGLNWQVTGEPLLYHFPNDAESVSKPRQASNDATTVYRRHDGTYEFYSAAKTFVKPGSPHYIEKDHAGGCIRILQRWTSADGQNLSDPEVILAPDAQDPPDLQFYYLSCLEIKNYRFGFVGRYRADEQRTYLELVYSANGSHWERPFRDSCFPLQSPEEAFGIYAAASICTDGETIYMPYSAVNVSHNQSEHTEERPKRRNRLATIPMPQLFGRQASGGALLSPPWRILEKSQTLFFNPSDKPKLEILDSFGEEVLLSLEIQPDENGKFQLGYLDDLLNRVVRFKLSGDFTLYIMEL